MTSKLSNPNNKRSRKLFLTAVIVMSTVAVTSLTLPRYFCFAFTPSLSHKLFWVDRDMREIGRGDYVRYMHKAPFRDAFDEDIQWKTVPMLKKVACNEGDVLTIDGIKRYFCNGEYIGRAKERFLDGRQAENFVWHGRVPPGMILPMGEHKDSYDGRYYGFISKRAVMHKAHPVFP